MVVYHLGFAPQTYLIWRVQQNVKLVRCNPLLDTIDRILEHLHGESEFHFHIDLSVQDQIPPCRKLLIEALRRRGIAVHNGGFDNQRKRNLQMTSAELGLTSLTANKEGDPDELLLVKSDLNVAGGPERRTIKWFPGLQVPTLSTRVSDPSQYYLAKRREIADEIWSDSSIHIERYINNSEGRVVRSFWNQGKAVVSVILNPDQVVKKNNAECPRWNFVEPIDTLTNLVFSRTRQYAEHLCLSFFAADWVVDHENSPYLVDLNLTPQWIVNRAAQTANMTPNLHMADIPLHLMAYKRELAQCTS